MQGKIMQEIIQEIVKSVVSGKALEVVDLEIHIHRKKPLLRVFIEKAGGITVDECAAISHELSVNFLVEEAIPDDLIIEVSSPGVDRPLRTKRDFDRNKDRTLQVRFRQGDKEAQAVGKLIDVSDETIRLKKQVDEIEIKRDSILVAKQHIPF
jgi:ribosome maturation factor RimP